MKRDLQPAHFATESAERRVTGANRMCIDTADTVSFENKKAPHAGPFQCKGDNLLLRQHPLDELLGFGLADLCVGWHRDGTPNA